MSLQAEKMNRLLQAELGSQPIYFWEHGSRLKYPDWERTSEGEIKHEMKADPVTGLIQAQRVEVWRSFADIYDQENPDAQVGQRWLICHRIKNLVSPDHWDYVHMGPWVRDIVAPMYHFYAPFCTGPGQEPTMAQTRRFIEIIRNNRRMQEEAGPASRTSLWNNFLEKEAAEKARRDQEAHERGMEAFPSTFNTTLHQAGKKDAASFPSVTPAPKE